MKLLLKISTILLSFLLVFVVIPKPTNAVEVSLEKLKQYIGDGTTNKSGQDYVKEFCDKRSGELMNLETWFSGKCGEEVDSLSGEGVGFVDIIQLQGMEWIYSLFSQPHKSAIENIQDNINMFEEIENAIKNINTSGTVKDLYALNFDEIKERNGVPVTGLEKSLKFLVLSKPASVIDYTQYVAHNLRNKDIIPKSYAAFNQGTGFDGLRPVLPLWKAFRNIAYMLFAIAFIMYGIMIMFRVRVDGKTAATITLAIPNLVTTLLLITFSYAIVGLLIDISTVFSALLIDVLRLGEIISDSRHPMIQVVGGQIPVIGGLISAIVNGLVAVMITPFIIFNLLLGGTLGTVVGLLQGLMGGIGILGGLIVILAIIWSYFKLVLALFKSYITVIVSLIFSPLILLGNVFPGSKSFSGWIMNIIANLSVFPVASFLLVLSHALMMQPIVNIIGGSDATWGGVKSISYGLLSAASGGPSAFWTPPMTIPTNSFGDIMLATIGLGLLLMASKYVDMILEALKVPPFKYGSAIGEALKFGYNQVGDENSRFRRNKAASTVVGFGEGLYGKNSAGRITGNDLVNGDKSDMGSFVGPAKSK